MGEEAQKEREEERVEWRRREGGVGTKRGRGRERCIGESRKTFVHLLISLVSTTQQNASMLIDKP